MNEKSEYINIKLSHDVCREMRIREYNGMTITVERPVLHRLIQEEIWCQTDWPDDELPLGTILYSHIKKEEDKGQIYHVSSDMDTYFVMILIAETEKGARSLAWESFKKMRAEDWGGYHTSSSELIVLPLGRSYLGSDGEGHLEV